MSADSLTGHAGTRRGGTKGKWAISGGRQAGEGMGLWGHLRCEASVVDGESRKSAGGCVRGACLCAPPAAKVKKVKACAALPTRLPVPVCRLLFLLLPPRCFFFGGFSGPFLVADDPGGRLSRNSAPHYGRGFPFFLYYHCTKR
jgi:hypothetical protein